MKIVAKKAKYLNEQIEAQRKNGKEGKQKTPGVVTTGIKD